MTDRLSLPADADLAASTAKPRVRVRDGQATHDFSYRGFRAILVPDHSVAPSLGWWQALEVAADGTLASGLAVCTAGAGGPTALVMRLVRELDALAARERRLAAARVKAERAASKAGEVEAAVSGSGVHRNAYVSGTEGSKYRVEVHARVVPGAYVELFGTRHEGEEFSTRYAIGDQAEYDSFNLHYFGEIEAIGKKTVTIRGRGDSRCKRLKISEFARRNYGDANEKHARDAETMMYI